MSLLIPLILLVVGMTAVGIIYWSDSEFRGVGFIVGLFLLSLFGPLTCLAYGTYTWLRAGTWGEVSIADTLLLLRRIGIDAQFLLEPVSWRGVQSLSDWYLASNIGWTLLFVPLAITFFWFALEDRQKQSTKK